jgi:hypothetical protein
MRKIPRFRLGQLVVSTVGTILIIPWNTFLGVMFTFSFRADESLWAWAFDVTAFWSQIIGILASFFKPRLAAVWMLLNIVISVLMAIGFEVKMSFAPDARQLSPMEWVRDCPVFLKEAGAFWGIPLVFALLLPRRGPSQNGSASSVTTVHATSKEANR